MLESNIGGKQYNDHSTTFRDVEAGQPSINGLVDNHHRVQKFWAVVQLVLTDQDTPVSGFSIINERFIFVMTRAGI